MKETIPKPQIIMFHLLLEFPSQAYRMMTQNQSKTRSMVTMVTMVTIFFHARAEGFFYFEKKYSYL